MDCDFSPSSPHLLPNGLFSPQNRISFELLALSGLSGFSTFKGGKMLIFQGFANSRIVREFPPFSFKVRIATLTRNRFVLNRARGFESHHLRQQKASAQAGAFLRLDGEDENRATARRPQAISPAGCCLARGRIPPSPPTKSTGSGWCFFAYPTGFFQPSKSMYQWL